MFYQVMAENAFSVTATNIDLVSFLAPESGVPTYFVDALEWKPINCLTFVIKLKNLIEGDFSFPENVL